MSDLAYEKRQTKTTFEQKLVADFGVENLSANPHEERGNEGKKTKMTLYYSKGTHVGTWREGKCWIFKSAYKSS